MTKTFVIAFRKAFLTALLFAPSFALSYPAVHDRAVFSGRIVNPDGNSIPMKLEFELVEASKGFFKQRTILTEGEGSPQLQEVWVPATELPTADKVVKLITSCREMKGLNETLHLGPSDLYTCALPTHQQNSLGTTWVADVPFGVAKAVMNSTSDAHRTEISLTEFYSAP